MGNSVASSNNKNLDLLLEKIYHDGGYDFRDYKTGTVVRRLERRLQATGAKTYPDYMQFLDAHPEEYERLVYTLTIAVSGFYRSHATFEGVTKLVLPELISHKVNHDEYRLRFWSAASARGEEPYSIAIMLAEFLGDRLEDFDILIYATDINQQALKQAQAGVYSSKDLENLPRDTLEKYFTRASQDYVVKRCIKKMVRFSYFDLTSTMRPPFMELDCIFCCNVLIYLQKQLQERLLGMLYEMLATPGYLVLGEVETPTDNLRGRLECLHSGAKIYQKNEGDDDV
jgi:two-component system CheB/CheR fusion protein